MQNYFFLRPKKENSSPVETPVGIKVTVASIKLCEPLAECWKNIFKEESQTNMYDPLELCAHRLPRTFHITYAS